MDGHDTMAIHETVPGTEIRLLSSSNKTVTGVIASQRSMFLWTQELQFVKRAHQEHIKASQTPSPQRGPDGFHEEGSDLGIGKWMSMASGEGCSR